MANSDKNILITPRTGLGGQPDIVLTGAGNSSVSIKVDDGSRAKLNFESGTQSILSLDSSSDPSAFSVADLSNEKFPIFQTENNNRINFNRVTKFAGSGYLRLQSNNILPIANSGSLAFDLPHKLVRVSDNTGTWTECYDKGIVRNGLILYYDFTNYGCYPRLGSTVYDLSGNDHNGTMGSGATFAFDTSYQSTAYAPNGHINFDGTSNGNILVTNTSRLDLAFDKTICMWWYQGADSAGMGIAGKGVSVGNGMHLAYGWSTNGYQNIDWNSSNTPALSKAGSRDLAKWVYLVGMVYQDVRSIFVIDSLGVRRNTSSGSASWVNGSNFRIGSSGEGSSPAASGSRCKSIQVYNRALTIQEIHRNYQYERLKFNFH